MNDIKKLLKEVFTAYVPSFFLLADSGFPRLIYDAKQIYTDEPYEKFIITCDIYDITTTERIDDIVSKINADIGLCTIEFKSDYYKFYKSDDRQYIAESDKSIKRIRFSYELRRYRKDRTQWERSKSDR